jgi:hypothetical protein
VSLGVFAVNIVSADRETHVFVDLAKEIGIEALKVAVRSKAALVIEPII